jgi:TolA-binding protein
LAHLLYGARRFAAAAGAYADFVKRRPDDPLSRQALFQQGLALKRCGRAREAAAVFNQLLEEAPGSVYAADAHLQLGQLYDALGSRAEAVAHYEAMGRSGGKSEEKESLLLRGQVHYNAKRYKAAIPFYRQFLEQNPGDPRGREVEELLLTSYWLGDRDNPELAAVVARYPRHDLVKHIRWAQAVKAYQSRDYARAEEGFVLFAADFPKDKNVGDSFFYQGECRMKLGDHQGAALAYKTFLTRFRKSPKAAAASLRLGAALFSAGDFNGSAEAYAEAATGEGPQAAGALYSQAVSLLQAADKPAALSAFEDHLRRFPKDARNGKVWLEVGRLREGLGKLSEAAFAYAHAGPKDSDFASALFVAARLRERLKQTDLAVRNYERLRGAKPLSAPLRLRGLLRLGLLYELKGQPRRAMPLYAEVLRLAPRDGEDFGAARRRLQELTGQGLLTLR